MNYKEALAHLALKDKTKLYEDTGEYETIHNKHDKGYKYLLSAKKVFIQLLRTFVRGKWVNDLDEQKIIRLDKSYILQDFKEKEADLVYLAELNKQPTIFYILMELQSTVDYQMPYRLLLYMVEIWRNIIKDTGKGAKTKTYRLPPVVPIVLYNGANNWTAKGSFKEYQSQAETFAPYIVDFQYILLDVNRYTEEELLDAANLIGTIFLLDQKKDPGKLVEQLKKLMKSLREITPEEELLLRNWLLQVLAKGAEPTVYKRIEKIITGTREVENMIYNLNKTIQEGLDIHLARGIREGEARGVLKEKREAAMRMLQMGSKIEFISDVTGLSVREIEQIARDANPNR